MHTKICAQQQSKITREMIGRSRDGNGWNLEFIIKPSQSQQGAHLPCFTLFCSPVLPHPMGYGAAEGQKGWGATAVECARDTRREQGKQERRRCWDDTQLSIPQLTLLCYPKMRCQGVIYTGCCGAHWCAAGEQLFS